MWWSHFWGLGGRGQDKKLLELEYELYDFVKDRLQQQYNDLRIRFIGQWQWVPIQLCILLAVPGVLSESSPESELIVDSYLSFATGSEA